MTLQLTPEALAAAYDYLRTTLPFRRWSLPPASEVRFTVNKDRKARGCHYHTGRQHVIAVSRACIERTDSLMPVLAHEMCHARQTEKGLRRGHGPNFQKMADAVCRHHGFDRALF